MDTSVNIPPPSVVKPLRPLVYNFFVSQHPESLQQTIQGIDSSTYKSFHSQKIDTKNNHFFRPTIQFKKLIDEPKFLLSVQRKKIKIMKGINQKASSQKPSRSSYRGHKLRNTIKTINPEDVLQHPESTQLKQKRIESQEPQFQVSPRKNRQPHLHFNLKMVLEKRKNFTNDFSREENITGSNFPYYNYFSSTKSSMPTSQKSSRYKTRRASEIATAKTSSRSKIMSTTVVAKKGPICQNF